MDYRSAVKRVSLLKGHIQPSEEAKKEASTATFNLEHAQEKLWSTLPSGFFDAIECASELQGLIDPSLQQFSDRDEVMETSWDFLFKLINKMFEKGYTSPEKIANDIDQFCFTIISPGLFDLHTSTRFMSHTILYCKTIKNLGTERHHQMLMEGVSFKNIGCYCLTELGHGSNAKGLETTATYDKESQEFIVHSPTQTSMKFWIGNLGKSAHSAVVLAQLLIEEDGKLVNKGVHSFAFEIRDPVTHTPYAGIEIGDCGLKKGLNGIDNGWMKFTHFRIPREALLNRFGDVTEEGVYKTDIPNDGKRFASSMAALSGGRVMVTRSSSECTLAALAIAIRFSAARRQFGPADNETAIIDYPMQQHRLFPLFAQTCVFYVGANNLIRMWSENSPRLMEPGNKVTDMLHGLSSNLKSFISLKNQGVIAECRRACGGHGYSKYALFENLLQYNDIHCTWEGDNFVLRMQTQKYLLKSLQAASEGKDLPPTLEFISLAQFEKPKFKGSLSKIEDLATLFRQVASYCAIQAANKLSSSGLPMAEAFAKYQHFELRRMCESYHDTYMVDTFITFIKTLTDPSTIAVFEKILLLHLNNRILDGSEVYANILGDGLFSDAQQNIQDLCQDLRKDIIQLIKIFPCGNRVLGALGNEDLQVYKRLVQHFTMDKGVTERPRWWKIMYQNR